MNALIIMKIFENRTLREDEKCLFASSQGESCEILIHLNISLFLRLFSGAVFSAPVQMLESLRERLAHSR